MSTGITNLGAFRNWIKATHNEVLLETAKKHREIHAFAISSIRSRTRSKTGRARAGWEESGAGIDHPGRSQIGSRVPYILKLEFGRILDLMVWTTVQEAKKRFPVTEDEAFSKRVRQRT
ncbi:MAG: hypothetical protein ACYSUI_25590 [Planctomycetota bacterium]|jgi:hypothetical protein